MVVDGWLMTCRRWFTNEQNRQLMKLRDFLDNVRLSQNDDGHIWLWNKKGRFTVKTMHAHISDVGPNRSFRHLWKAKLPLKIKIWLWLIWHNAIATKYNMVKRKWVGVLYVDSS